jgi:tRNA nucleotidyltransferase (CCA-adding enzyme)
MNKKTLEQILQADAITENEEKIIFEIIPELLDEKGFPQNNPWHIYDVWNHTKKVFENSKPDKEIRLVLLLHDIGKPHSFQDDENGTRHFSGHSQKSAEISEQILKRLGYSESEISEICFFIANHDKTIRLEMINFSNLEKYKKLLYIQYCDASGYNPEYIKRVFDRLDAIAFYLKTYQNRDEDTKGEDRR